MRHADFHIGHLGRRSAAHLAHAFLQGEHAIHAGVGIRKPTAIGIDRQFAARRGIAFPDEILGFTALDEAKIFQAIHGQMREGVIDHQMIHIAVLDAGHTEGFRPRHAEGAR